MREPFIDFMRKELGPNTLLIACGLPASYKTETTEVIAKIKGYHVLRTDMIRLEVLRNEDIFDEKVASNMAKRTLVYDEMSGKGKGIILDATFITQALRRRAAEAAARHDKDFVIQQTYCSQEISIGRILKRTRDNYESNALTEQAYLNNKSRFEEVDLDDLKEKYPSLGITHLLVDTNSDREDEWFVTDRTVL